MEYIVSVLPVRYSECESSSFSATAIWLGWLKPMAALPAMTL